MHRFGQRIIYIFRQWLQDHAAEINHNAVRGTIFADAEISTGYLFILNVANLIALCGLLLNSSPVIIGAMLISPLMEPILSFGFAFVTGDRGIWKRSVRKIALSVFLTIIVASIASFLSPLKDVTGEIISRTKPNLYDLIIAFLAGIAGASALCTKKNYLTIVPGVAIATAVIPPLSVAGFGLGTANFSILYGGFLLFFTNFVAIVISTCVVFYFFGFRPGISEETDIPQLKKRFAYLLSVLLVISIPLAYTLHTSIAEVRERLLIQNALGKELNIDKRSRLGSFSYKSGDKGVLEVSALVNTVSYLDDNEIAIAEKDLEKALGKKTKLNLEQVKVQAGGLKKQQAVVSPPAPVPRSPGDMIREAEENVRTITGQSREKINRLIAPSTIIDFSLTLHDRSDRISIDLSVRRDSPFSPEETLWLERMIASEINRPVVLTLKTVPFVPPLYFKRGETAISNDTKKAILSIKEVFNNDEFVTADIKAYPEYGGKRGMRLAVKRIENIIKILVEECNIPDNRISTSVDKERMKTPMIRITLTAGNRSAGKAY